MIDLSITFMNLSNNMCIIWSCLECLTGLLLLCNDLNYDIISFILYWHKFLTSLWMSYLNLCSHCRMVWVFLNLCYERHIIFDWWVQYVTCIYINWHACQLQKEICQVFCLVGLFISYKNVFTLGFLGTEVSIYAQSAVLSPSG